MGTESEELFFEGMSHMEVAPSYWVVTIIRQSGASWLPWSGWHVSSPSVCCAISREEDHAALQAWWAHWANAGDKFRQLSWAGQDPHSLRWWERLPAKRRADVVSSGARTLPSPCICGHPQPPFFIRSIQIPGADMKEDRKGKKRRKEAACVPVGMCPSRAHSLQSWHAPILYWVLSMDF